MKVLKIQQNSEEWLEYRKGKSGGSGFKDLWISGLPLKSKIVEFLEKENPLSPEDKKAKVEVLAGMLTPEELAELKLEAEPKRRYYEMIAEEVARPITPNDYADKLNGATFSMMERGHIENLWSVIKRQIRRIHNTLSFSYEDLRSYLMRLSNIWWFIATKRNNPVE